VIVLLCQCGAVLQFTAAAGALSVIGYTVVCIAGCSRWVKDFFSTNFVAAELVRGAFIAFKHPEAAATRLTQFYNTVVSVCCGIVEAVALSAPQMSTNPFPFTQTTLPRSPISPSSTTASGHVQPGRL
jgi:hypothetical protein